jgi:small subunit ribosomal protein S8
VSERPNQRNATAIVNDGGTSSPAREFGLVAQKLGFTDQEARPRRWIARIGALLRTMREHSNLKQEDMAKLAEVTQSYLSRLENGLVPKRGPTIDVLLRCAQAAGCEIDISIRSKSDQKILGRVSSADLERPRDVIEAHTTDEPIVSTLKNTTGSRNVDPIADLLTRIRDAQSAGQPRVGIIASKLKVAVLKVLHAEGYIGGFKVINTPGSKNTVSISLKYHDGRPVIDSIERVSRPGLRIYRGKDKLPTVSGGLGVAVVSTPQGIMSDKQAKAAGTDGEILFVVR